MVATILNEIVDTKRREIDLARREVTEDQLRAQLADSPPPRDFFHSLAKPGPIRLIAEINKVLERLERQGTLAEIQLNWYGQQSSSQDDNQPLTADEPDDQE